MKSNPIKKTRKNPIKRIQKIRKKKETRKKKIKKTNKRRRRRKKRKRNKTHMKLSKKIKLSPKSMKDKSKNKNSLHSGLKIKNAMRIPKRYSQTMSKGRKPKENYLKLKINSNLSSMKESKKWKMRNFQNLYRKVKKQKSKNQLHKNLHGLMKQ